MLILISDFISRCFISNDLKCQINANNVVAGGRGIIPYGQYTPQVLTEVHGRILISEGVGLRIHTRFFVEWREHDKRVLSGESTSAV